VRKRLKQSQRR